VDDNDYTWVCYSNRAPLIFDREKIAHCGIFVNETKIPASETKTAKIERNYSYLSGRFLGNQEGYRHVVGTTRILKELPIMSAHIFGAYIQHVARDAWKAQSVRKQYFLG